LSFGQLLQHHRSAARFSPKHFAALARVGRFKTEGRARSTEAAMAEDHLV
jgi:hypothetical protein